MSEPAARWYLDWLWQDVGGLCAAKLGVDTAIISRTPNPWPVTLETKVAERDDFVPGSGALVFIGLKGEKRQRCVWLTMDEWADVAHKLLERDDAARARQAEAVE